MMMFSKQSSARSLFSLLPEEPNPTAVATVLEEEQQQVQANSRRPQLDNGNDTELEEFVRLKFECAQLQTDIDDASFRHRRLEHEILELRLRHRELHAEICTQETEKARLEEQRVAAQQTADRATKEYEQLRRTKDNAVIQKKEIYHRVQRKRDQVKEIKSEEERFLSSITTLKSKGRELCRNKLQSMSHKMNITKERDLEQLKAVKIAGEIDSLQDQYSKFTQKKKIFKFDTKRLRTRNLEMKSKIDSYNKVARSNGTRNQINIASQSFNDDNNDIDDDELSQAHTVAGSVFSYFSDLTDDVMSMF